MPHRSCVVPGCGKTSSLHKLPKDPDENGFRENGFSLSLTNFLVTSALVSHSQTFRLTAEGLDAIATFIGQGPPKRMFDWVGVTAFVSRWTVKERDTRLPDIL
ncbi:hypothetical protein DPX16_9781 [Anabarilius grahami]|uniref:Uncharacterized protein n=1 Tax=Anabarilius grahami TaxID=495550 RepID=A0A3N0Y3M8_ANAGA|nr:hypothetical protein DPX16_9781 [Anabarilius grahami]